MSILIRDIGPADNAAVERLIRDCLIEFGADHEGTAWADPDLGRFSEVYSTEGSRYWVAEADGEIVCGAGIGKLTEDLCELQKMYCRKDFRGSGAARLLMEKALDYAKGFYRRCCLETLDNMTAAQRFYEKYGFERIGELPVKTGHFACQVRYIRDLTETR